MWPVDKRVTNVKNNDPSLIEPVAACPTDAMTSAWAPAVRPSTNRRRWLLRSIERLLAVAPPLVLTVRLSPRASQKATAVDVLRVIEAHETRVLDAHPVDLMIIHPSKRL